MQLIDLRKKLSFCTYILFAFTISGYTKKGNSYSLIFPISKYFSIENGVRPKQFRLPKTHCLFEILGNTIVSSKKN
jgi:hypothetical protein